MRLLFTDTHARIQFFFCLIQNVGIFVNIHRIWRTIKINLKCENMKMNYLFIE